MVASNYSIPNGEDKAIFPAFREFLGRVRAGWIVFVVVISVFTHAGTTLINTGWITVPAKDSDLKAMRTEFLAQIDSVKRDHLDFKATLAEIQKSEIAQNTALAAIAAVLAERSAPAAPPPPKKILPSKPKDAGWLFSAH